MCYHDIPCIISYHFLHQAFNQRCKLGIQEACFVIKLWDIKRFFVEYLLKRGFHEGLDFLLAKTLLSFQLCCRMFCEFYALVVIKYLLWCLSGLSQQPK